MASRIELHNKLVEILGNTNVYFQPPETLKLAYPCIVYKLDRLNSRQADNEKYIVTRSYTVTLIHKDPDNEIVDKLFRLPGCRFDRPFTANNLNHYVFTLYY